MMGYLWYVHLIIGGAMIFIGWTLRDERHKQCSRVLLMIGIFAWARLALRALADISGTLAQILNALQSP